MVVGLNSWNGTHKYVAYLNDKDGEFGQIFEQSKFNK